MEVIITAIFCIPPVCVDSLKTASLLGASKLIYVEKHLRLNYSLFKATIPILD